MDLATFDVTKEITLTVPGQEADKKVTVRFPSDQEWIDRRKRQKLIIQPGDKLGESEDKCPNRIAEDARLFEAIQVNKDVKLDEYEASQVIGRLERATVKSCEAEGRTYVVTLQVPGGLARFTCKRPTQKDASLYDEQTTSSVTGKGFRTVTIFHAVGADVYDRIIIKAEGYAGAVPVCHKVRVVAAIMEAFSALIEDDAEGF